MLSRNNPERTIITNATATWATTSACRSPAARSGEAQLGGLEHGIQLGAGRADGRQQSGQQAGTEPDSQREEDDS